MRHVLLVLAALISLQTFFVAPASAAEPAKTDAKPAATSSTDDDEDEPPKSTTLAPAKDQPPPAALGAVSTTPTEAAQQRLVSGAPLYNPNVAVHIVEKKEFTDRWSREITLYPAAVQLNGKFTQHLGAALAFTWHLQENFALTVSGLYNYVNSESGFQSELIDKVSAEAQAASSSLLVGGVLGGVEVTPFYGKFVFYDSYLVHFAVVLNAGAGAGLTRHQLKAKTDCSVAMTQPGSSCTEAPTYGDTGWRFLAELGGGFRVQFLRWLTFRLELRDVIYTAKVDHIDGCDLSDFNAMDAAFRLGRPATSANVGPGCNAAKYTGEDAEGRDYSGDISLGRLLVKDQSSDVLNNLGLYVGFSFNF